MGMRSTKLDFVNSLKDNTTMQNYFQSSEQYHQSNALKQKEVALSENQALGKKLSKSKVVVEDLRTCLKDARMGMRSTKLDLVNALKDNTTMQNDFLYRERYHQSQIDALKKKADATLEQAKRGHKIATGKILSKSESKLAATERKHKGVVNTITKLKREHMTAKDDLHAVELEEQNNGISVSPSFNTVAFLSSITHNFVVRP